MKKTIITAAAVMLTASLATYVAAKAPGWLDAHREREDARPTLSGEHAPMRHASQLPVYEPAIELALDGPGAPWSVWSKGVPFAHTDHGAPEEIAQAIARVEQTTPPGLRIARDTPWGRVAPLLEALAAQQLSRVALPLTYERRERALQVEVSTPGYMHGGEGSEAGCEDLTFALTPTTATLSRRSSPIHDQGGARSVEHRGPLHLLGKSLVTQLEAKTLCRGVYLRVTAQTPWHRVLDALFMLEHISRERGFEVTLETFATGD